MEPSVVRGFYAPFASAQCPPGRASQNPQWFWYSLVLSPVPLHPSLNVLQTEPLRILSDSGLSKLTAEFLLTHTQYPLGRVSTELLKGSVYNSVSTTLLWLLRCSATPKSSFCMSCWIQGLCPQHVFVWLLTSSEVPPPCTGIQSLSTLSRPHGMNPQRPFKPEHKTTPC
jgi:hypothetical protein